MGSWGREGRQVKIRSKDVVMVSVYDNGVE